MAGLYIHIPFCASRCIYCGFYSTTLLEYRQRYVDALCKEMEMRPFPLPEGTGIDTIYLGGGTPSQLTIELLQQLFLIINKVYMLPSSEEGAGGGSEITIECNPDDVSEEFASALPQLGINRVSMGAQTFDNKRLRFLHRRHTAEQVPIAVERLRKAGIHNISIDLMYGFPGETIDDWEHDIDAALHLNVEHLSAYCLMIEEGTPLYMQLRVHSSEFKVDEELERQMYELLINKLTAAGYEHYEISNFAKPGFRSRHNSNYWRDIPYLGLGAAAHSYDRQCRSWNVANIHQYMEAIEKGVIPCEHEVIDEDTHYNDRITVALRTKEGLDLNTLSEKHRRYCMCEAQRFLDDNLLVLEGSNRLRLTPKGLFVSDYVMSSLIFVE